MEECHKNFTKMVHYTNFTQLVSFCTMLRVQNCMFCDQNRINFVAFTPLQLINSNFSVARGGNTEIQFGSRIP